MEECSPACRDREKHCRERLEDTRKLFILQSDSMEKAIAAAKSDMERRLEGMNQFRAQLERQADSFLDRGYYDVQHRALLDKIEALIDWRNRQEGKAMSNNLMSIVAILISVIFGILHFVSGMK
jgi:hypothetical protein